MFFFSILSLLFLLTALSYQWSSIWSYQGWVSQSYFSEHNTNFHVILITTFIMPYYLSKLQKPDFFKWDTQCLSPVFIGVIIFLPFSLPMYEYDSWPNPTAKILFLLLFLLKSPIRILSLQALLSFPIPTQNPVSSTEMKVISPTHLFSTQLMSPTKPLWESIIYCSDIQGWGFTCSPFPWLSYIRLYVSQGQS